MIVSGPPGSGKTTESAALASGCKAVIRVFGLVNPLLQHRLLTPACRWSSSKACSVS